MGSNSKDSGQSSPAKDQLKPVIGLALGYGVARGWAHIGVLRALMRYNIIPEIITGTSIGAVVGGSYVAGKLDDLEKWALSLNKMRIASFVDLRFKGSGLIGGDKVLAELQKYLSGYTIEDLPKKFVCIAADLVTGHEVWLRKGSLPEAMRASFSVPGIFPPLRLNGRWLVDGGLVNPLPVSPLIALGANISIAVNLGADILGKTRQSDPSIPTIAGFDFLPVGGKPPILSGLHPNAVAKHLFRREPNSPSLFGVMASSLNIMQDRLTRSRLAGDPPDVQISPRVSHIGLFEFDRAEEMIAEGEAAVLRALPEINDALTLFGQG